MVLYYIIKRYGRSTIYYNIVYHHIITAVVEMTWCSGGGRRGMSILSKVHDICERQKYLYIMYTMYLTIYV